MKNPHENIRNIIFDLGGVLLNIDYRKTEEAFSRLGISREAQGFNKEIQTEIFKQLERGQLSGPDFIREINALIPARTAGEITSAWNAMLLDFPIQRFNLLQKLSEKYRLFLLSNTNIIHLKAFREIIEDAVGWNAFENLFEGIGLSHELGQRKPDEVIFETLLKKYELRPKETLFIDDTPMHVAAAKKTGINAIHLEDGQQITDLLKDF